MIDTIRLTSRRRPLWRGLPVQYSMYSDNTPIVKLDYDETVKHADTLIVRPKMLMDLIVALFLADSIRSYGGRIQRLILPYVPGARQDRTNPTGDVLFSAASVASMINEREFEQVIILDPHSPVIVDLLEPVLVYTLENVAPKLPKVYDAIIAPDKGAGRRAEIFAKMMGLPTVQGEKTRDVTNGRLTGFAVEVEAGKHYLVVDDICDGGGTFEGLGLKIRQQLATADLYVSHGIFSKGTKALRGIYNEIYTTNSLYVSDRNEVEVIDVITDMEKL